MIQFWNERYSQYEYAYGEAPNVFFKRQIDLLPPGLILLPAEGEGRNAVYAARKGWTVLAFDQSAEGRKKALLLAEKYQVSMHYAIHDGADLSNYTCQFDAIGLIYAHFSGPSKSAIHHQLANLLKPEGVLILEAFGKNHLEYLTKNPAVGGPKDLDMLYSTDEILIDFPGFETIILQEEIISLAEGSCHNGEGAVVRYVGKKHGIAIY